MDRSISKRDTSILEIIYTNNKGSWICKLEGFSEEEYDKVCKFAENMKEK